MPRHPRTLLVGFPHHIVQRGHDRQPVFVTGCDYRYYLDNLKELRTRLGVRVYGYCLMTNHVHLVLEPVEVGAAISRLMKALAARQTRRINRLENRSGTLWEGRFKSSIVDSTRYLLACLRYVDLNPVRASIVEHPQDYLWSSHRALIGRQKPRWLDIHPELAALGNGNKNWRSAYAAYVAAGVAAHELDLIRSAVHRNQLTGEDRFREEIAIHTGRRIETRGPGRPGK